MLNLTLYKGERLEFTHRETGEVINVTVIGTHRTSAKVDVEAGLHWKILRTDRRKKDENSNSSD